MKTIKDYNVVCHAHIDDDFELLFAAKPPPSEAEIEAYCREIDCALPQDFRCLIGSYLDGFYVNARESVWPDRQGGLAWIFYRGFYVYGLAGGLPEWINLRQQTPAFREKTQLPLTPCLKVLSDPDIYCFGPQGDLLRWSHETYKAKPVGSDFFTLFEKSCSTLRTYKERAKVELTGDK